MPSGTGIRIVLFSTISNGFGSRSSGNPGALGSSGLNERSSWIAASPSVAIRMLRYVRVETRLIDLTPSRCAGPEQLADRVVEGGDPALDGRVAVEGPDRVVVQERGGRPDAHQRGGPIIAPPASRRLPGPVVLARDGIVERQGPGGGQGLVLGRGELLPDVPGDRVARQRPARVLLELADRVPHVVGEGVVRQEVVLGHGRPEVRLDLLAGLLDRVVLRAARPRPGTPSGCRAPGDRRRSRAACSSGRTRSSRRRRPGRARRSSTSPSARPCRSCRRRG